jgi:hypothetical protein
MNSVLNGKQKYDVVRYELGMFPQNETVPNVFFGGCNPMNEGRMSIIGH